MESIFITGGAGYIGSHTVKRLIEIGYKVIVYDNLSTGHIESVDKKALFIKGDLADKEKLETIFKTQKISVVLHFAANSLVQESIVKFDLYLQNNILNGLNLLDAMIMNNIKKLVFSSSAVVYGEPKNIPIGENQPIEPINPYGFTKASFESILMLYDKMYSLKSISLRYFNAAGAHKSGDIGEWHAPETHLIPNVLSTALKKNKYIEIFGTDYDTKDGTCIRDYIHVSDIVEAHILALSALNNGKESSIYNLGIEKGYSVKEIINISKEITGINIPVKVSKRRQGDPAILLANSGKIKKELKWEPHNDIYAIIRDAWNWYKKHPNGYNP